MSSCQNEKIVSHRAFKERQRRKELRQDGAATSGRSQFRAQLKARLEISRERLERLQKSRAQLTDRLKALGDFQRKLSAHKSDR
jgi:hypothetical protein